MNLHLPSPSPRHVPSVTPARVARDGSVASVVSRIGAAFEKLVKDSSEPDRDVSGVGVFAGGRFYRVRSLTEADTLLLHNFLQTGLGKESREQRFLSASPSVSIAAATYLADRDGHDRVALVATDDDADGKIVAMVEYANVASSPDIPPEVALAVADDYQGHGLGRQLLHMLAVLAVAAGQNVWSGTIASHNAAAFAVLETVGNVVVCETSAGVTTVLVYLERPKIFVGQERR